MNAWERRQKYIRDLKWERLEAYKKKQQSKLSRRILDRAVERAEADK